MGRWKLCRRGNARWGGYNKCWFILSRTSRAGVFSPGSLRCTCFTSPGVKADQPNFLTSFLPHTLGTYDSVSSYCVCMGVSADSLNAYRLHPSPSQNLNTLYLIRKTVMLGAVGRGRWWVADTTTGIPDDTAYKHTLRLAPPRRNERSKFNAGLLDRRLEKLKRNGRSPSPVSATSHRLFHHPHPVISFSTRPSSPATTCRAANQQPSNL